MITLVFSPCITVSLLHLSKIITSQKYVYIASKTVQKYFKNVPNSLANLLAEYEYIKTLDTNLAC